MNKNIIEQFEKLIQYKEQLRSIESDSKEKRSLTFSINATRRALTIIQSWKEKIKNATDLKGVKNIGSHSIERIKEILENGILDELIGVDFKISKAVDELKEIPGIGPSNAFRLVKKYGIKNKKDLFRMIKQGKIEEGKYQLSHQMIIGVKYFDDLKQKIPKTEMIKINHLLKKEIKKLDTDFKIKICGSFRRKEKESGDVDVLISHSDFNDTILKKIVSKLHKCNFLIDDITLEKYKTKYMGICKLKNGFAHHIDIRFIKPKSWGSAILYFTGSGSFNVKMRIHAETLGYKLSEYGLYKRKTEKRIKTTTEKEIFDKLGIKYLKPQHRNAYNFVLK